MRLTVLLSLMLLAASPALAQDSNGGEAPVLGNLLKKPAYFEAWQTMIGGETTPDWIAEYTATLDGPPVPNIPVTIGNETYTLGFTCKANECEDNQMYVLFSPDGSKAWALLGTDKTGLVWLGYPDEKIQAAINGVLKK